MQSAKALKESENVYSSVPMAERSHRNVNGKDSVNSSTKNNKKASSV